jgi:hypothetical protein
VEPRGTELLQTDRPAYLLWRGDVGFTTDIPFEFTNGTGDTVYVLNCWGQAPPSLEKEVGGSWVPAWSAIVLLCLSPPIVIPPGAAYQDTVRLFAGYPGNNAYPKFEVAQPNGTYRLVWRPVVHHYHDDARLALGDSIPLRYRISNDFRLVTR